MKEDSLDLKFAKDLVAYVAKQYNIVYNSSPLLNCSVPDSASPFTRNVEEVVRRILCLKHRQVEEECEEWTKETMKEKFKSYISLKTFVIRNRTFEVGEFLIYCTTMSLLATIWYSRGYVPALGLIVPRIAFTLEYKRKQNQIDSNIWCVMNEMSL